MKLAVLFSITAWLLLGAVYLLFVATTFGLGLDAAVARRGGSAPGTRLRTCCRRC